MIIIYFSGTGNSKYIAEQFAKRMDIQAYSIEQKLNWKELLSSEDTIAVCYPIYGSCVPRIMRSFAFCYRNSLEGKSSLFFARRCYFPEMEQGRLPGCFRDVRNRWSMRSTFSCRIISAIFLYSRFQRRKREKTAQSFKKARPRMRRHPARHCKKTRMESGIYAAWKDAERGFCKNRAAGTFLLSYGWKLYRMRSLCTKVPSA